MSEAVSEEDLKAEIKRLRRLATDRSYMMQAYANMLGPKGIEVVRMWDDKGVTRFHSSWGPEAANMTGEERAQALLDVEAQIETAKANERLDSEAPLAHYTTKL